MNYIQRFRESFKLPGRNPYSALAMWTERGDYFVSLSVNKYGLIRLRLWERYDDYTVEAGWVDDRLVLLEGKPEELAPLVWIAEQIGLPDHQDFEEVRQSSEYARIAKSGITLE